MIRVIRAFKVYNKGKPNQVNAVVDANLHVKKGDMAVIRGPSGSGKTTLLTMIGCITRPTSGEVHVAGKKISRLPERFMTLHRRRHIGFIFQQFNLIPDLVVRENVALPLYPQGLPLEEIDRRVDQLLVKMRLEARRSFLVKELSGGEQQRVAIARALVNDPEVLLADEPTAHLDTHLSNELMEIVNKIKADGKTIVIASHDPLVYSHPSVDILISMRDGRIKED